MTLPAFYMNALFQLNLRWLNCLRHMHIPMTVALIGAPLHFFLCHLFVDVWQLDVEGIAYALTITSFSLVVMLSVYQNCIPAIEEALFFPTKETWLHWGEYIK